MGLLAELDDAEILKRADPLDLDGDGISGRPNWDRGFVGRFGMKSQTVSIEGFIRGPLMNHLGVTTDPLTDAQRAALPVDSSSGSDPLQRALAPLTELLQAAAPDGPLVDDDAAADPELSTDDLFDLVSFAMLLAPPEPEPLGPGELLGRDVFDRARCGACHTPRLQGPRGPLPVYSDLLVHDLGPALADATPMKESSGSEFRTSPLWGVVAGAPYLHDGRAGTLEEAILWHGGEAEAARDVVLAATDAERDALVAFLGPSAAGRRSPRGSCRPAPRCRRSASGAGRRRCWARASTPGTPGAARCSTATSPSRRGPAGRGSTATRAGPVTSTRRSAAAGPPTST